LSAPRKVDVRLPGKGKSNSHDARPVHLIITTIKWIRASRLSTNDSLSPHLDSTEKCSGSEAGSYLRLIDFRSLNSRLESNKTEEEKTWPHLDARGQHRPRRPPRGPQGGPSFFLSRGGPLFFLPRGGLLCCFLSRGGPLPFRSRGGLSISRGGPVRSEVFFLSRSGPVVASRLSRGGPFLDGFCLCKWLQGFRV